MVFTVTSSNCEVKIARFYEFLFTLGWRQKKSKSLDKFPFPQLISCRKYSNLNFRVFTVRNTKIGILSQLKKAPPLDFQQYNHFKYQKICLYARMLVLERKEGAFVEKVNSKVFVDFRRPYWCTKTVHQHGVLTQSSTKVCETFGQITQKL